MKRFALLISSALLMGASALPASATPLPNAVSYEYFGLNYANNIVTSNTVGTLDYTGLTGCGGTCSATTQLGSSPSRQQWMRSISISIGQAAASLLLV